jgi:hypothetical protein
LDLYLQYCQYNNDLTLKVLYMFCLFLAKTSIGAFLLDVGIMHLTLHYVHSSGFLVQIRIQLTIKEFMYYTASI